jgi:FAD:protein FMN transferase
MVGINGASRCGALIFCLLTGLFSACHSGPEYTEQHVGGEALGTTYNVKVIVPAGRGEGNVAAVTASMLAAVDERMSTYRKDSELSGLNGFESGKTFPVSEELAQVLLTARQIGENTSGAFDITVGPLVNAWGFGPQGQPERIPPDEELQALREITGWDNLEIDEVNSSVTKAAATVYCDLSGIAKGYAVDRVSEQLLEAGYENHMVEVGGEVQARGENISGKPWRIGIERPAIGGRALHRAIELRDVAMATSGDYRNYFEVDGVRYSHIIDPRTGAPIRHRLASVSVVEQTCTQADGYATALLVLGENRGYDVAVDNDLAALFLVKELDGSFTEKVTPRFEALFGESSSAATGENQ